MKDQLKTLQNQLEELEIDKEEVQNELDSFELDESDYEDSYIEMIDSEGAVMVAGMAFTASRILQELDPIAYNCGLSDYVGSMDLEDCPDYKDLQEKLEGLESEIEALEEEIEEIEAGIE